MYCLCLIKKLHSNNLCSIEPLIINTIILNTSIYKLQSIVEPILCIVSFNFSVNSPIKVKGKQNICFNFQALIFKLDMSIFNFNI